MRWLENVPTTACGVPQSPPARRSAESAGYLAGQLRRKRCCSGGKGRSPPILRPRLAAGIYRSSVFSTSPTAWVYEGPNGTFAWTSRADRPVDHGISVVAPMISLPSLNLIGAPYIDLGDLGVAHKPLDREVGGVAGAAEQLFASVVTSIATSEAEEFRGRRNEAQIRLTAFARAAAGGPSAERFHLHFMSASMNCTA